MNEKKYSKYRYLNSGTGTSAYTTEDLCAEIKSFFHKNKMNSSDWISLNNMIKQLERRKVNLPQKVLRSMRNKFELIQNKYQR